MSLIIDGCCGEALNCGLRKCEDWVVAVLTFSREDLDRIVSTC